MSAEDRLIRLLRDHNVCAWCDGAGGGWEGSWPIPCAACRDANAKAEARERWRDRVGASA